jgi:hypothetical protein
MVTNSLRSGDPYRRVTGNAPIRRRFSTSLKTSFSMIAVGTDDLLESSLGFLARSIFWLGLVYSSMPFDSDSGQATGPAEAIGPITAPGLVAACAHGMSEDCRSAVERLRLAADIAAASVGAGEAFRKAATTSRLADAPRSKDKALPTRSSVVLPADSR